MQIYRSRNLTAVKNYTLVAKVTQHILKCLYLLLEHSEANWSVPTLARQNHLMRKLKCRLTTLFINYKYNINYDISNTVLSLLKYLIITIYLKLKSNRCKNLFFSLKLNSNRCKNLFFKLLICLQISVSYGMLKICLVHTNSTAFSRVHITIFYRLKSHTLSLIHYITINFRTQVNKHSTKWQFFAHHKYLTTDNSCHSYHSFFSTAYDLHLFTSHHYIMSFLVFMCTHAQSYSALITLLYKNTSSACNQYTCLGNAFQVYLTFFYG